MALPPPNLDACVEEEVASAVHQIDSRLANECWVKDTMRGEKTNPHWVVVINHELSKGSQEQIARLYRKAGWGDVRIKNSSENNEPAGICAVDLYKNRQD